jgi:hypothetical protein
LKPFTKREKRESTMKNLKTVTLFLVLAFFASSVVAQASDKPKMATKMPEGIKAPTVVK